MTSVSSISERAKPVVEAKGAYLIDVAVRNGDRGNVVEIFADTDGGITTDLCAEISRELSEIFDGDKLFPGRYYLVVSSPGIDRPLKFQRQYAKNIGRSLTVKYKSAGQAEQIRGELLKTDATAFELRQENGDTRRVEFDAVMEARVNAPW